MNLKRPATNIFACRKTWTFLLTAFFIAAVAITFFSVHRLTGEIAARASAFTSHRVAYAGLAGVLVFGGLSLWTGLRTRREGTSAPQHASANGRLSGGSARRTIEEEIAIKNRKITESINYARRIQSAILPNPRLIHRALPDSFLLYKPLEVVSGDFPWFAQVKNDIFMAAVDCTGHGVPGALLSLVGYFLLNDIVRSRRVTDPGKILDYLDEGVSTTLRPNEDAGTKDGMDISFCRINVEEREVAFAGAHRSLYVVRNGVLEEIRGNKFPIGGGIFKNQTNFTTTQIKLGKGDSIFFCSDGYCDQFGGPEGRKLGARKLRDIISRVHALPMKDAAAAFDKAWESWRGNQKQIDDVLLIGIKF